MIIRNLLFALCIISSTHTCQKFNDKRTKELQAYKDGKIDVIQYLITKHANPHAALDNIRSYDDQKATEVFTVLTNNYDLYISSNPQESPETGTLFFHAALTAKKELLSALISHRINKQQWPSSQITQQINAEHVLAACAAGADNHEARTDIATILLTYSPSINNDPSSDPKAKKVLLPPLHAAVKARNISLITLLLAQQDINVNLQDTFSNKTPLHVLFNINYIPTQLDTEIAIANLLLEKGANPDIEDDEDNSAHKYAQSSGIELKRIRQTFLLYRPTWIVQKKEQCN